LGIGRLKPVDLRDIWPKEAGDFTTWLEENLDVLGDALGLSLSPLRRETPVGPFQADLLAEDEAGRLVVIENQLEATDHDHLGKLLTYVTNLEAKTAIWITRDARPQHAKAVAWLNEVTPDDISFYLVRVAAYRIGESDPAPHFEKIVGPSEEAKAAGGQRKELAERHVLRRRFWTQFLQQARERGVTLFAGRSPSIENWLSAGAGRAGLSFQCLVWLEGKTAVELSIDTGDARRNKQIFDTLRSKREEIEQEFGDKLEWDWVEGRRSCHVRYWITEGGLRDEDRWPVIIDAMIEALDRLARVFKPRIMMLPN